MPTVCDLASAIVEDADGEKIKNIQHSNASVYYAMYGDLVRAHVVNVELIFAFDCTVW